MATGITTKPSELIGGMEESPAAMTNEKPPTG